jgi:ssRNA-specific RNase YbeY (16S rRNA maturation enzyme)
MDPLSAKPVFLEGSEWGAWIDSGLAFSQEKRTTVIFLRGTNCIVYRLKRVEDKAMNPSMVTPDLLLSLETNFEEVHSSGHDFGRKMCRMRRHGLD